MKKIQAIIEKADDGGISIYSEDVNGAYGFGLTEQEAKEDFVSVLEEQAEYYKEKHGEFPSWYKAGYSVVSIDWSRAADDRFSLFTVPIPGCRKIP